MAQSQKRDCSSFSMKEKDALKDLEIEKDFFTSWKSVSMTKGDELDFDLTPVSKGNKKSFDFDKVNMDFNLDGDFGKMSSFKMDMSDLDISSPFKKDGKSIDKAKDSSFNMDMSDLDISPLLKKDGKSMEKQKESSSGKDKGKTDRFAFTFDFDELENFSFNSSLEKEGSKAQIEKNNQESSPDRSGCQDKEGSMNMNVLESTSTSEDGPQEPSLPETGITFERDCLDGGSSDLIPTRKTCHSNLALDEAVTTEHSSATDEVASDKEKSLPETMIVSRELPYNRQSIKLVTPGPSHLEACTGKNAMQELSSDYPSNKKQSGANSSEEESEANSMHANATGSNGEEDADMISVAGSTCEYKQTLSENSQHLQNFAILENVNDEKSQDVVEHHVINNGGKTELAQSNSLVENQCTTSAVAGILCDSQSGMGNQEPASKILMLPFASQPADPSEKQTEIEREPPVNCSRPLIRSEKPECPLLKLPTQAAFSSLSSKKTGFAQPSLVEGRRDTNAVQNDKKLVSLPMQHSKTPLRGELPQIWYQENCNGVKINSNSDGLQNAKKLNESSEIQIKDMVKTKPAIRQREMSMKELDTLSMEINRKAAKNSENPTTLASIPTVKNTPVEEHKRSSAEVGKKTPDLPGLKLKGLSLDSTKSWKDSKSIENSSQKSVLLRKTPPDVARFPGTQKQTPASTLPMKRALEDAAANIVPLYPSKRLSQSASTNRNLVEPSERVLNEKVPSHSDMEVNCIKSTAVNCQNTAIHIPHEVKNRGVEISFSIQNDSNIKLADNYSKELDDLCNVLRKKNDEAKEILALAILNSNNLLLLYNPQFEEKIHATQDLFARLTLNSVHG